MARKHGVVKVEVWDVGSDFRKLTRDAQRAYMMLLSQPSINNCGVLAYTPERWAMFARDDSIRSQKRALTELGQHDFVVVDTRTRELLVRTFIKHDRIERQPNLKASAQKQFHEIESVRIRQVLASQHAWLSQDTVEPLPEPPGEPLDEPLPVDNSEPLPGGVPHVRARETPAPSPTNGASATEAAAEIRDVLEVNELGNVGASNIFHISAAAPEPRATTTRVAQVVQQLRGVDPTTIRVVEPLAMMIPAKSFEKALKKLRRRKNVQDESALFVHLLQTEVREKARERALAIVNAPKPEAPEPASKRARKDPKGYLGKMIPELSIEDEGDFSEWLERFLVAFVPPEAHPELRQFARTTWIEKGAAA